jgi:hypothetical protein
MNEKDTKEYKKEFEEDLTLARWSINKALWILIPTVIVICIIGWVLKVGSQGGKIIEKTVNADNVIYNYEWFHSAYEDIQATDIKIKNSETQIAQFKSEAGDRANWDFSDKEEYSRLNSVLLGLQNYRQDVVAKYNARSKMVNRKIFKGQTAPEEVQ